MGFGHYSGTELCCRVIFFFFVFLSLSISVSPLEAGSAAPYGSQPRAALITKASSPLWECKTKKLLENLAPLFGSFLLLT